MQQTARDVIAAIGGKPYPDHAIAQMLDVAPSAVRTWAAGNRFPKRLQADIEALARAAGVEVDPELFPSPQKPGRKGRANGAS